MAKVQGHQVRAVLQHLPDVLVVGRGGDVVAGGERGGVRPQEVLVPGGVVFVPAGDDDAEDEKRKILLKGVVSLAQSLGISCITEGVETLKQSVFLKSVGCYLAQGFFFDRPMPKESFVERLTAADKGFTKGPR